MAKLRISLRGLRDVLRAALPLVEAQDDDDPETPTGPDPTRSIDPEAQRIAKHQSDVERLMNVYKGMKPEAPRGSPGVHGVKGRPETPAITKDYKGRDVQAPYLMPRAMKHEIPRSVLAQRDPRAAKELPDHPGKIYLHNATPVYVPDEPHMKTMVWAGLPAKGERLIDNPDKPPMVPNPNYDPSVPEKVANPRYHPEKNPTVSKEITNPDLSPKMIPDPKWPRKVPNPKYKPEQPPRWRLPEELGAKGREQVMRVKPGERQLLDPRDLGKAQTASAGPGSEIERGPEAKPRGRAMWDPTGGLDIGGWSEMMGNVPGATPELPGRGGGIPSASASAAARVGSQARGSSLDPETMSLKHLYSIRDKAFDRYKDSREAGDKRLLDRIDAAIADRERGVVPKGQATQQGPTTAKPAPTQVPTSGMKKSRWQRQEPEVTRVTRPKK